MAAEVVAHFLLGSDCTRAGKIRIETPKPDWVMASTAGSSQAIRKKHDANEDAAMLRLDPAGMLAAVADAHFGCQASHQAIQQIPAQMDLLEGSLEKRIFHLHFQLDRHLLALGGPSATTLACAFLNGDRLVWASSGDSQLCLLRKGRLHLLNPLQHEFFLGPPNDKLVQVRHEWFPEGLPEGLPEGCRERNGEWDLPIPFLLGMTHFSQQVVQGALSRDQALRILDILVSRLTHALPYSVDDFLKPWHPWHLFTLAQLPSWGSQKMEAGDVLMLATDGIEPRVSGVSLEEVNALLNEEKTLVEKAETILRLLLRAGGKDNCTLILHQIPA
jgi:serine/threonine protein phosphatase PrpC